MQFSEECTICDVSVLADMHITGHHIPEGNLLSKNMFIQILEQTMKPREIPSLRDY
jgi:hypothetical protein